MFVVTEARTLAPDIRLIRVGAPRIARRRQAGQFVIVRVDAEFGERIPLTIADSDEDDGTITLIVQGVGKTTKLLNMLQPGETIADVVGPLGQPSDIRNFGTVVVVGGGVGTAIAYPTAVALKRAGNHVIGIVGARTKDILILEQEMGATTDELYFMTDDGSYGERGFVTQKLQSLLEEGRNIDHVLAIGPIPMMQAIADVTRPRDISTIVSLNPIMVDGTGMCGGCRVLVGGQSKFACVDGPEFDAHDVDFTILAQRNTMYRRHERGALEQLELTSEHCCQLRLQHPDVGPDVQAP